MSRAARRRAAAALALALSATACGVPADGAARLAPEEEVPFDLLSGTTTSTPSGSSRGQDTTVCLALDGSLLAVFRGSGGPQALDTLLSLVTAGATEGESNLGLRSAVDDEVVSDVSSSDGTATVELLEEFGELPGNQQLLAVAQMTCTLTAQPDVVRVRFLLDDEQIEVPIQGGSLVDRAVTRADYERLYANP